MSRPRRPALRTVAPREHAPGRVRRLPGAAGAARRIVMLLFPNVQVLDVTGPLEVFHITTQVLASASLPRVGYDTEIVAPAAGPVRTSGGVEIVAPRPLSAVRGPIDTLIVPGGIGTRTAADDSGLVAWIRRTAARARRVASVCTGTLLIAEAGLTDGRRVTTHWAFADDLARRYPNTTVDSDPVHVRDGKIYSSAGVTAGMDLALALVEDDHGRAVALEVARWLVLFLKRPGGQSQFSTQLAAQLATRVPLRDLQTWIVDHVSEDLSVERLARRVAMSPRNFARMFVREVGVTPARFVERARVETARRRLEETPVSVDEIASACGFGAAETMRRAFLRNVRVTPADYRSRFRSARVA
jgi:transcriptional regulator GlxA family with amidase domain